MSCASFAHSESNRIVCKQNPKPNPQRKHGSIRKNTLMKTFDVTPGPREKVYFRSNDITRKLIIPRQGPKQERAFLNETKLTELKKSGVSIKAKEEARREEKRKNLEELKKDQEARLAEFEAYDAIRKKNEQLNEMEEEAKSKMEYFREKANEIIREQNEEIKEINQLILSAKAQTIREAQVEEKKHIKKELAEAEANLDRIMEKQRREGVIKEREMQKKRKEAAYKAAGQLVDQMKENEEHRLIEEGNKIKEGELLLKKLKKDQIRELQEMKTHQIQKRMFLEELQKTNIEIGKRKEKIKEESNLEDKIIAEYQRRLAKLKDAEEAAAREEKRRKEIEFAKLEAEHGRAAEIQAEQEALRARRAQEEKEREYRRKEKEDALKRKQMIEDLNSTRAKQIEQQENLRHMKAAADIKELEMLLQKLKKETVEEMRKDLFRKLDNLKNKDDLKVQMRKKEMEKINEKRETYKDFTHRQQEECHRNEMLNVLKKEKLNELKKLNIPDTYVNHIKRKVQLESS